MLKPKDWSVVAHEPPKRRPFFATAAKATLRADVLFAVFAFDDAGVEWEIVAIFANNVAAHRFVEALNAAPDNTFRHLHVVPSRATEVVADDRGAIIELRPVFSTTIRVLATGQEVRTGSAFPRWEARFDRAPNEWSSVSKEAAYEYMGWGSPDGPRLRDEPCRLPAESLTTFLRRINPEVGIGAAGGGGGGVYVRVINHSAPDEGDAA